MAMPIRNGGAMSIALFSTDHVVARTIRPRRFPA
jgi:hypothetical protein